MASTSTRPLVDRILPDGIESFLADTRGKGDSFQTIANKLRDEHGVSVTPPTIREWCNALGIAKGNGGGE